MSKVVQGPDSDRSPGTHRAAFCLPFKVLVRVWSQLFANEFCNYRLDN